MGCGNSASPPPFFRTKHVSPGRSSGETCVQNPLSFKGFGRSSHHSRSIPHRPNSSFSAASHSLFGPNSPFLLDRVRKSSSWINPLNINGLSPKGHFRGLWKHVLCSVVSTREFEPSSKRRAVVGTHRMVHLKHANIRTPRPKVGSCHLEHASFRTTRPTAWKGLR